MLHSQASSPHSPPSPGQTTPEVKSQGSLTLRFDSDREYLPIPHPLMLAGGWLALLTLVAVLLGCWATPYNAKVKAPALVRPRTATQGSEPSLSPPPAAFEIQAWVPNDRITAIHLGQRVQLRVNSCPYPTYGVLEGQVSHIATDTPAGAALTQPAGSAATPREYANAYQVTIQPEAAALAAAGQKSCELRAGMEGRADIWVGQARLLTFLISQVRS